MNFEWSTLWAAVAAIAAVIAIVQSFRGHQLAKKSAEFQGVFSRSNIRAKYFGLQDRIDILLVAGPLENDKITMFPVIISAHNEGERTIEDAQLILSYSKGLRLKSDIVEIELKGLLAKKSFTVSQAGSFETVLIDLGLIHPHITYSVNDYIVLRKSLLEFDVSAKTSDDVNISFPVAILFSSRINTYISARNCAPIVEQISVIVIDTSKEALSNIINRHNNRSNKAEREKRPNMWMHPINFFRYIRSIPKPKRVLAVEFGDGDIVVDKNNLTKTVKLDNLKFWDGVYFGNNTFFIANVNLLQEKH